MLSIKVKISGENTKETKYGKERVQIERERERKRERE